MIKGGTLENIIDIFQQHERFEYVDFKIQIHEDTINIVYMIEPRFNIEFQDKNYFNEEKEDGNYNISGHSSPGKFSTKENFLLIKKSDLYIKIKDWLDIIWKEISLTSPLGLLEKEQEYIDKFCEKFDKLEGYFTTKEILEIREELEKLKLEIVDEIKVIVKDGLTLEYELDKLYKDFTTLEQTIPYLKKKGWIRSITGRIFHNMKRLLDLQQQAILNKSSPLKDYNI